MLPSAGWTMATFHCSSLQVGRGSLLPDEGACLMDDFVQVSDTWANFTTETPANTHGQGLRCVSSMLQQLWRPGICSGRCTCVVC